MLRFTLASLLMIGISGMLCAQPREEKVRSDRKKVEAEGFWIYNDLAKGFETAKKTGKPLLVVLRCVPCEECVKLDDELVDQDTRVRPLLEKFVCVRQISTNGLDLTLFQFDYDQSFAAFMLNADGTIYGRFGTRSHRTEWIGDVSIDGLAKALEGALDLHKNYPKNKDSLVGKRGPKPDFSTPESFPAHIGRYKSQIDFAGKVVPSCIHCHQIGDAHRDYLRKQKKPIPERVVFPYPHPKSIGLILDPKERASVLRVESGSLAEKAGFRTGDAITSLHGQPLLSIADVQWVLHYSSGSGDTLKAELLRGTESMEITLTLPRDWRRLDDISWRASTWGLRRMTTGGLVLEPASKEDRQAANVADGSMALRVKHVGQYGAHAAGKNAGFRQGDIIVSINGKSEFLREADWMFHSLNELRPGDRAKVSVMRDGKKVELNLPMQD